MEKDVAQQSIKLLNERMQQIVVEKDQEIEGYECYLFSRVSSNNIIENQKPSVCNWKAFKNL